MRERKQRIWEETLRSWIWAKVFHLFSIGISESCPFQYVSMPMRFLSTHVLSYSFDYDRRYLPRHSVVSNPAIQSAKFSASSCYFNSASSRDQNPKATFELQSSLEYPPPKPARFSFIPILKNYHLFSITLIIFYSRNQILPLRD